MRAGTYYVIAAVLVLATLPMYRYIFQRARAMDAPPRVSPVGSVARAPVSCPRFVDLPLNVDQRCYGGAVITIDGSSYVQALDHEGRPLVCYQAGRDFFQKLHVSGCADR